LEVEKRTIKLKLDWSCCLFHAETS